MQNFKIVKTVVNAPISIVWNLWITPYHVMKWNNATEDWYTPKAKNNLILGKTFSYTMASRDGAHSFDFWGTYDEVIPKSLIAYTLGDGRKVKVNFSDSGSGVEVMETFELENMNSPELQEQGWQAILNNFKKYTESLLPNLLQYSCVIPADPKHIYNTMIGNDTYAGWTKIFNPTSRFEGSWQKGQLIFFLGEGEDGKSGGMVSMIAENMDSEHISISHIKEWTVDDSLSKEYAVPEDPSFENYSFIPVAEGTLLVVDMLGGVVAYKEYFDETWPKALDQLSKISSDDGKV
ncbi:MAG: SRPBCC domain-containing protein [Saprospiraceae bacterium]